MIKKGDLVMITRPMRCGHGQPGYIFTAGRVVRADGWMCEVCGQIEPPGVVVMNGNTQEAVEMWRLTKIDPPPIHEQIIEEAEA